MFGQLIGSTIAAVFGVIYVIVNSGDLPAGWTWTLRGLAVAAFTAVLAAVARAGWFRRAAPVEAETFGTRVRPVFGRQYWSVVGIEVVALFAGTRRLSGPLHTPQAGVAWVSLVVGTHFFALAVIFAQPFFHWLGAAITACGAVGIVLAITGAGTGTIGLVAGVVPGALLLGFGWWGARRRRATGADVDAEPGER